MAKLKDYFPPHLLERVETRGAAKFGTEYILGNFLAEYGHKPHPDSEPQPLSNPHRRAFLVQGRGLQGVIYIIDASGDQAALVTVITLPHDEWGPLPDKYKKHWVSAVRKK